MKKQQLDYLFFYLKCPRKYKKTNNFDIFLTLPKFAPLLPSKVLEKF